MSDNAKKKKIAIVGVSAFILVAMVVAVAVGISGSKDPKEESHSKSGQTSVTSKSIKSICQPVDYKKTCEDSLTKASGNTTDPQKLIQASFNVAIESLQKAIEKSNTIKSLAKDPMEKQALDNCKVLIGSAIRDLKASFDLAKKFDMSKIDEYAQHLKIWLSATITYQQTCLDGFQNSTSKAGKKMKDFLSTSSMMTSNVLAMVDELSSIFKTLDLGSVMPSHRKLLETQDGGYPEWMSASKRRLLAATPATTKPNVIVAQDGSGQFKTIGEAVAKIPKKNTVPFVIYIKAGIYKEHVSLTNGMNNVVFIGDGPTKTKITGSLCYADGVQTFNTATVAIDANNFMAKDIGFENSAGAKGHQAVAIRVASDMSIFYNCQIDGYQDTLYTHTYRQFYRDCTISGTIDFVFGDAAVLFQNCKFVVRKPLDNQQCIVTAHGRNTSTEATGIVIQNSTFTADPEYYPVRFKNKAYLGRPWKEYAKTIIMQSQMDDLIDPEGWLPWMGTLGLDTCYYGEFMNRGPGSSLAKRVTWKGIKKITPQEANSYVVKKFIQGVEWIPQAGVEYYAGLK